MPDYASMGAGLGSAVAPGIGTLVGGLIGAGVGLFQRSSAKKNLKKLQYPTESLPSEFTENQNIARRRAAEGMPSEQYANAMKNIQRQQMIAIRGAQDRRAGAGLIPLIQQGTNDATLNLDSQDAQMRLTNERNLMSVNTQVAGQKRDLFDLNTRQKYNRDYDYYQSQLGAGNQNFVGGIDKIAAGGLGLVGGGGGGGRSTGSGVDYNTLNSLIRNQYRRVG